MPKSAVSIPAVLLLLFSLRPALAQNPDDSLRIYAVNVVKTTPFRQPTVGHGVYLGRGAVLTAAHVIGRWGFLKSPHVLVAGQNLPAKIVKEGGAPGQLDLTLLSVDETLLPISLRLRRNPLCKQPPYIGEDVIIALPERTSHYTIVSPTLIHPVYRAQYNTLINTPADSGAGVFDANKKCLMGIVSLRIAKIIQPDKEKNGEPLDYVGYFISASLITNFIPVEFRF